MKIFSQLVKMAAAGRASASAPEKAGRLLSDTELDHVAGGASKLQRPIQSSGG
jgi:hypothetical protein